MKHQISAILLAFGIITPLSLHAQENTSDKKTPQTKAQTPTPSIVEINQKFSNLPKKSREEYMNKLSKARTLFNHKRIFDALEKVDELNQIFPNHPTALNIKGACYIEIRAFDKANAIFSQIYKTSPNNPNILFNLAEVDFVTRKWKSAEKRYTQIIPMLKNHDKSMTRLCELKLLICKLKLGKQSEAEALMKKYDEWDDSPFYHYSRAVIAYHAGKKDKAEKQLRDARFIWRNNGILSPWQDSLIESGYIRSFYGGDLDNKNTGKSK